MSSWARVGVKCVCVDDGFVVIYTSGEKRDCLSQGFDCPRVGDVVTIRGFCGKGGLLFIEHNNRNRPNIYGTENGFNPMKFRPLITEQDDIAMFKELLAPHVAHERELDHTPSD